QVEQNVAEPAFDHMAAHAPQNRPLLRARPAQGRDDGAKRIRRQKFWQRIEPARYAFSLVIRAREMLHLDFAAPVVDRNSLQSLETQRLLLIAAHLLFRLAPRVLSVPLMRHVR